ncbi:MAG: archease [Chloroflexaceae bacterium]
MDDACVYEELAHTADVGMRVRAPTPAALFACAAQSLVALAGAVPGEPTEQRQVSVEAVDAESLLVEWLNEVLYLCESSGAVVAEVLVRAWRPTKIVAEVRLAPPAIPPRGAIKAITYHRLRLAETPEGWLAEYYVDV